MLVIAPGCTDQRNAARERLEHPNRRNTWQRFYVRPSRDVQGHTIVCERLRHPIVGEPARVVEAGIGKSPDRIRRVPYTINPSLEPELFDGLDQKLLELGRALFIAPVPN